MKSHRKDRKDRTGERYGMLTVIGFDRYDQIRRAGYWKCACDCGQIKILATQSFRGTKSCGCMTSEWMSQHLRTHGESHHFGVRTKEYRSWAAMKTRCGNPKSEFFHCYGAIGIKVCDRWRDSFINFLDDMGRAPSPKHSIDRIDNSADYKPGNCRWATAYEQSRNKRSNRFVLIDGKRLCFKDCLQLLKIGRLKLLSKIQSGEIELA